MSKSTAVIDKSLLERIYEDDPNDPEGLMRALRHKFRVIVAFPLIEEIMRSIARPARDKSPAFYLKLKREIDDSYPCWMNDVFEIAFDELVLEQRIQNIPWLPTDAVKTLDSTQSNDPGFVETVKNSKREDKEIIAQRKSWQNGLIPPGKFYVARSEKEHWNILISILQRCLTEPSLKLLDDSLGRVFRHRHPDSVDRIEHRFANLNFSNIDEYPFTRNYLMLGLIYQFGPISKVLNVPQPPPIIERGDQDGNLADSHYVASSFLCDTLLTGDQEMAEIAQIFRANGLWAGTAVWVDRNQDLSAQLAKLLS